MGDTFVSYEAGIVPADTVADLRKYGFDLRLAFEDDRRNLEMFRAEGIPCVYIHSGYFD